MKILIKILAIGILFLIAPKMALSQTPPPHVGDLYLDLDENGPGGYSLSGKEEIIKTALKDLHEKCGLKLNVIITNKDCPVIGYEEIGDKYYGFGPGVPIQGQNTPPVTSNLWYVENQVECIVMKPYSGGLLYNYRTMHDVPFQEFQDRMELDFPSTYKDYGSKYACQILNFIDTFRVKMSNCTEVIVPAGVCSEGNNIADPLAYDYLNGTIVSNTQSETALLAKSYQKHFKSSFCSDLILYSSYNISNFLKETPDNTEKIARISQKKNFILLSHDNSKNNYFVSAAKSSQSNPLASNNEDNCYPQFKYASYDDLEEINNNAANNGSLIQGMFSKINDLHGLLTSNQPGVPGNLNCVSSPGNTSESPLEYFGNKIVRKKDLKYKLGGALNLDPDNSLPAPNNGNLHDYTGGINAAEKSKLLDAVNKAQARGVKVDIYTSVSKETSGYTQSNSFTAAKNAFKNHNFSESQPEMALFMNYDLASGNLGYDFKLNNKFYQSKKPVDDPEGKLKPGMDEIIQSACEDYFKMSLDSFENASLEVNGDLGASIDSINTQLPATPPVSGALDKSPWTMGLWNESSKVQVSQGSLLVEGIEIIGETVWNQQLPERLWDPGQKQDSRFHLNAAVAGVGDGLLELAEGKVIAILSMANVGKEFISNAESRKQIIAAFRYPSLMAVAQYGTLFVEMTTDNVPERRWHAGTYLGTKILIDITTGSFLTAFTSGIKKDWKQLSGDIKKSASVFSGGYAAGYNLGMRRTANDGSYNDPKARFYTRRHEKVNQIIAGLPESVKQKAAHPSGVYRDIIYSSLDYEGNFLLGIEQPKLEALLNTLPDPASTAPSDVKFLEHIQNLTEKDVASSNPPTNFVGELTKDLVNSPDLAQKIKEDPDIILAWDLVALHNDIPNRLNHQFLTALKDDITKSHTIPGSNGSVVINGDLIKSNLQAPDRFNFYKSFAGKDLLNNGFHKRYLEVLTMDQSELDKRLPVLNKVLDLRAKVKALDENAWKNFLQSKNYAYGSITYQLGNPPETKTLSFLSIAGKDTPENIELTIVDQKTVIPKAAENNAPERFFEANPAFRYQDSEAKVIEYLMKKIMEEKVASGQIPPAPNPLYSNKDNLKAAILNGTNIQFDLNSEMKPCSSCASILTDFATAAGITIIPKGGTNFYETQN